LGVTWQAAPGFAAEPQTPAVTLAWNPNQETNVAGYFVYYGLRSGEYAWVTNVGKVTQCTITGLKSQQCYFFAVTAWDATGTESEFSREIAGVPGPLTVGTALNQPVTVPTGKLLARLAGGGVNGGLLTVSAVIPASARGGTVAFSGSAITYTPPRDYAGKDSFTYTLDNGQGNTATGAVVVTVTPPPRCSPVTINRRSDGNLILSSLGYPGSNYALEWTPSLTAPISWYRLGTQAADATGLLQFVSVPLGDAGFYRTQLLLGRSN
jgi:hypothetical protein